MDFQLDDSNIVPNPFVGGKGGKPFYAIGTSNIQILEVWQGHDKDIDAYVIRAIRITWENGNQPLLVGTKEQKDTYHFLELRKGERIRAMELWGAGGVDSIKITTDQGKNFPAGGTGGQQHYMDVGSGFLEGFEGNAAGAIDRLKPRFSKLGTVPQNAVVQNIEVGGSGGEKFWACRADSGTRVHEFDVWEGENSDKNHVIRGLQVIWEDGTSSKVYGTEIGQEVKGFKHTRCELNLDPSNIEKITEMTVRGAGRVDGIEFKTSYGQSFVIGGSGGKPFPVDVAGGVLLGFKGAAAGDVDRLAPIFMTKE